MVILKLILKEITLGVTNIFVGIKVEIGSTLVEVWKARENLGRDECMRERINLDVDTYAAPCISDHCASALPAFLLRTSGAFLRNWEVSERFVRSFNDRSIDRYRRRGSVAAPQLVQEPWNSANSCGTVWRILRTRFTHESFFRH